MRDKCLCLHLQRAARVTARRFDDALRPLGVTSGWFSPPMSSNQPTPPGIGSIPSQLAIDRAMLTANLKPLERQLKRSAEARRADLMTLS